MTAGKATALALGFAGALGLGVLIGPYIVDRETYTSASTEELQPATDPTPETPKAPVAAARVTRPAAPRAVVTPASAPAIQARMRPVLNSWTNLKMAADGFRSAEEFAMVAHASRNTGVPFMVLKDRVLNGKSLASAIHEFKPELDASAEVKRARALARADVAAISGN